jgi:hypothetical protein
MRIVARRDSVCQRQSPGALLNGGAGDARLDSLAARSVAMLQAAASGDYAPLHQVMGGEMPMDQVQAMHEEYLAGVRERLGAKQGVEHVGTSARGAQTLVRMRFERGTELLRIGWENGRIAGLSPMREAPPAQFVPVARMRGPRTISPPAPAPAYAWKVARWSSTPPSGPVRDEVLKKKVGVQYRGTENSQRNRGNQFPLFLWLLSVLLYPSPLILGK